MLTTNEIRSSFLKFFESKGHKVVKSSPLILKNDNSILFTIAGMVQFKNYFIGKEIPTFTRATTAQKCVRANDLDNVGYTARHHTFFEMLGNFSFGDYFKKDAISYAWEFLTKVLKLPKERLYVTIYHTDDEAFDIWHKTMGLSKERIVKITTDDNFWSMGEVGPCGPCSEIFYDQGEELEGGLPGSPEEDGDRYLEIYNIVFMQFEKFADGTKKPLPKPSIDTGMGLERIANVLQGVHNNFETDIFRKLIANSKTIIGEGDIVSHRIIADHLRASVFLIADGLLPSNEGRGYVLRRIMRRAMRHIHQLGATESCMYKLVPTLVDAMGETYSELKQAEQLIMETLKVEEDRFKETLDKGLKILDKELLKLKKGDILSGEIAFKLYDTYGFPLDLTQDILRQKGLFVDVKGFDKEMERQKQIAKESWVGSGETAVNKLYFDIRQKTKKPTQFVGYAKNTESAKILALIVDGKMVKEVLTGQEAEIIVNKTPFYGECGGQVGDSGLMIKSSKDKTIPLPFSIAEITDTKRPINDLFVHKGKMESGSFKVGDYVNLSINVEKRKKIQANHSATHLMHYALRKILGNTLAQKGSYVDEHRLRFDVSYNKQITKSEIKQIERIVNELIIKNSEVNTEILDLEEAKKRGAIALFGEKYEDKVRMVSMGINEGEQQEFAENKTLECSIKDIQSSLQSMSKVGIGKTLSMELCGGAHTDKTGDIGLFKIVDETSVAAGVRRIEAVTGLEALNFIQNQINTVEELADLTQSSKEKLVEKVKNLMAENKKQQKELARQKQSELSEIDFKEEKIETVKFVYKIVENINPKNLKSLIIDKLNKECKTNTVLVCVGNFEDKVSVMVGVSKDLTNKLDASVLVKKAVETLGGKGAGGQNWFAMGGGKEFEKAEEAVNAVLSQIKSKGN
jgi:alanyl-tRNA synthetase